MYSCMYVHIFVYAYIHTYIHTYTHTPPQSYVEICQISHSLPPPPPTPPPLSPATPDTVDLPKTNSADREGDRAHSDQGDPRGGDRGAGG